MKMTPLEKEKQADGSCNALTMNVFGHTYMRRCATSRQNAHTHSHTYTYIYMRDMTDVY